MSNTCSITTDFTVTNALITTAQASLNAIYGEVHDILITDLPAVAMAIAALKSARGKTLRFSANNGAVNWETALNIASGRGKILYAYFRLNTLDADQNCIQFLIDGATIAVPNIAALKDTDYALCYQDRSTVNIFDYDTNVDNLARMLNYEFRTNLMVQLRRPNSGGASSIDFTMFYIDDLT